LKLAQTENAADTVGGQIEAAALGLPAGLGDPIFGGINAKLSALLFSLPRVTAVEFGAGVAGGLMNGSAYNDIPFVDTLKGQISTKSNHCGGLQGGITNGMPLVVRVTFAPSPTIGLKQSTVHRSEQRDVTIPPFTKVQTCDLVEMSALVKAAVAITIVDILS
ncbi:MAG: chorismate synthase, partial [Clostridia bacterium]|nr:chorismate synthase [Clostridia bacterium]